MKPRKLTLFRFGPFADTEVVDFDRLTTHGRLFLINGPTGSGKSTVLDGMTYALYGEPRQSGQGPERKGRDFVTNLVPLQDTTAATRTRVEFEFDVAGVGYRVVRYPEQAVAKSRKSDDADSVTKKPAEAHLETLDSAGVPIEADIVAGVKNVDQALTDVLGLTVEQFRQTVVIPQGLFRDVVTDNERRINVLKAIFDTQRFAAVERALGERKNDLTKESKRWEAQRQAALESAGVQHVDELRASLREEEERIRSTEGRRGEVQRALDQANRRLGNAVHVRQQREELARAKEQREATTAQGPAMEERRVRLARAEAAREIDVDYEGLTARREDLAHAERGVREATRRLAAATEALEDVERARARALEHQPRIEALQGSIATLEGLRDTLREVETREARLEELDVALASQRAQSATLRRDVEAKGATRDALREERARLASVDVDALERERHDGARKLELLDEIERLEEAARRAADEAAADGVPAEPEGVVSFEVPDLERFMTSWAHEIVAAPNGASPAVDAAQALRRSHLAGIAAAKVEAAVGPLRDQIETLEARRGWQSHRPTREELTSALEAVTARIEDARAANERIAAINEQVDRLGEELEALQAREHDARIAIERSDVEREGIVSALEAFRGNAPDGVGSVRELEVRRVRDREELDALVAEVNDATQRHQNASTEVATANALVEERTARRDRVVDDHARSEAQFTERLAEATFADEAAFLDARLARDELAALTTELRAFDAKRKELDATVERLSRSLEGTPSVDVPELEREVAGLQAERDALDAELTTLRGRQQERAGHEASFVEADAAMARARTRESAAIALADVARGEVKGNRDLSFETFVLRRQFLDVLAAGNTHFQRMSGNRYAFHLVEDATKKNALDLEVTDNHADAARRSVKTLSGGESFLAALGLALGMSETAQRAKHPIEALFIDEGFGSLDQATLQEVSRILMTLPDVAGRMVGIISHVEGLKRLIPNQLRVVPARSGTGNTIVVDENGESEVAP